jgi:hypothetical protein
VVGRCAAAVEGVSGQTVVPMQVAGTVKVLFVVLVEVLQSCCCRC